MMPSPKREPKGYLQRVLADGARPAQFRGGARALLGAAGGAVAGGIGYIPLNFVYGRSVILDLYAGGTARHAAEDEARCDLPAVRPPVFSTPPVAGVAKQGVVPSIGFSVPPSVAAAPVSYLLPEVPAHHRSDELKRQEAHRSATVAAIPPTAAAFNPSHPSEPPARVAALGITGRRVAEDASERVTGDVAGPAGTLREHLIDMTKLSAPMRALLPLLGKIRLQADSAPSMGQEAPERRAISTPFASAPQVRVEGRSTAISAIPVETAQARPVTVLPVRSAAPVSTPSVSSRTGASERAIATLRHATQMRAKTPSMGSSAAAELMASTGDPGKSGVQRVERMVTERVVQHTRHLRVFWERRHLGRPHMRAFR